MVPAMTWYIAFNAPNLFHRERQSLAMAYKDRYLAKQPAIRVAIF